MVLHLSRLSPSASPLLPPHHVLPAQSIADAPPPAQSVQLVHATTLATTQSEPETRTKTKHAGSTKNKRPVYLSCPLCHTHRNHIGGAAHVQANLSDANHLPYRPPPLTTAGLAQAPQRGPYSSTCAGEVSQKCATDPARNAVSVEYEQNT